ncbi:MULTISPECIES: hypothetical protein [Flavobacterium]|uniref:Uncharacterized protein n=1 Tax=Flavobacterium columnare TaxID=996 RepID=A0AA94F181_9FLAO|nr:hypothetical protein [Flavobacterium columnare]MCH4829982.1 hypothetical protein [Flavobacterium columnare]MCH4832638.1 hypothetical protein [Flavobacterium columnare]
MFRTGEATFNSYTSKPSKEVTEKQVNKKGFPLNTGGMPLVDYVTMAGTRNTGNPDYKGGDEQFNAINTPWFMDELCTNLLGYKEVSSINSYDIAKKGKSIYNLVSSSSYHKKIQRLIDSLNEKLSKGYRLILNIDSDLISPDEDYHIPNNIFDKAEWKKTRKTTFEPEYHWIVLESPIQSMITNLDKNGEVYYTINFKVFTWGMPIGTYLKTPITYDHFYTNFYGDIYAK